MRYYLKKKESLKRMADHTPIDPSIVIEVVEDVGENETLPHSILPPTASARSIDDEPTQVDKGLPRSLHDAIQRGQTTYEPHTAEVVTTDYRAIIFAVLGGIVLAFLMVSLLLYVTG